jgi:hypothetical protein
MENHHFQWENPLAMENGRKWPIEIDGLPGRVHETTSLSIRRLTARLGVSRGDLHVLHDELHRSSGKELDLVFLAISGLGPAR